MTYTLPQDIQCKIFMIYMCMYYLVPTYELKIERQSGRTKGTPGKKPLPLPCAIWSAAKAPLCKMSEARTTSCNYSHQLTAETSVQ